MAPAVQGKENKKRACIIGSHRFLWLKVELRGPGTRQKTVSEARKGID